MSPMLYSCPKKKKKKMFNLKFIIRKQIHSIRQYTWTLQKNQLHEKWKREGDFSKLKYTTGAQQSNLWGI